MNYYFESEEIIAELSDFKLKNFHRKVTVMLIFFTQIFIHFLFFVSSRLWFSKAARWNFILNSMIVLKHSLKSNFSAFSHR